MSQIFNTFLRNNWGNKFSNYFLGKTLYIYKGVGAPKSSQYDQEKKI